MLGVREFRSSPFAWQDKTTLRILRESFLKQKITSKEYKNARNLYCALTEIASDNATDAIKASNKIISIYSGIKDRVTIYDTLKILNKLEIINTEKQTQNKETKIWEIREIKLLTSRVGKSPVRGNLPYGEKPHTIEDSNIILEDSNILKEVSIAAAAADDAKTEKTQTVNDDETAEPCLTLSVKQQETVITTPPSSATPPAPLKPKNEVNQLLEIFYEINPGLNFGRKDMRDACDWLIKQTKGLEGATKIVQYAISIQNEKYAPLITTPIQLKNKFGDLIVFKNKQTQNLIPII